MKGKDVAFRFSLERLLRYREFLRDQAKQYLAEALGRRLEVEQDLLNLRSELEKHYAMLEGIQKKGTDIAHLLLFREYISRLKEQATKLEKQLEKAEKEVAKVRRILATRQSDVKALESLKERDFRRYLEKIRRSEQERLDEIACLICKPGKDHG